MTKKKKRMDEQLNVRCHSEELENFIQKCRELGIEHYDMTREFMVAFTEDRVTIKPTEEQLKKEGIYK